MKRKVVSYRVINALYLQKLEATQVVLLLKGWSCCRERCCLTQLRVDKLL